MGTNLKKETSLYNKCGHKVHQWTRYRGEKSENETSVPLACIAWFRVDVSLDNNATDTDGEYLGGARKTLASVRPLRMLAGTEKRW